MNIRNAIFLYLTLLMVTACDTLAVKAEQCDSSIRAYNRMIRWQEYESAEKAVEQAVLGEFRRRLTGKELKVTDYRIKSLTCNAEKGEAEVILEYDYYLPPSTTMKTVEDAQKWHYSKEAAPGGWRVVTPPPEFR